MNYPDHDEYEQYLSDIDNAVRLDQETRLEVLDAAASSEHRLISAAVAYLVGGDPDRRKIAAGHVNRHAAVQIAVAALKLHQVYDAVQEAHVASIGELVQLRNVVAHGWTEEIADHAWVLSNDPTEEMGKNTFTRVGRSGEVQQTDFPIDRAQGIAQAGRHAAVEVALLLTSL